MTRNTLYKIGCLLATISLFACSSDTGELVVEVCGDLSAPDDITEARVSVLDEDREESRAGVIRLLKCPEDELQQLPRTVTFGSPVGEAWIVVQGLKDGAEIMRFERRARLDGNDATFRLGLTRDCIGIECPLGQTCIRGNCEISQFDQDPAPCGSGTRPPEPDAGTMEQPGPDAGMDGPRFCPEDPDDPGGFQ